MKRGLPHDPPLRARPWPGRAGLVALIAALLLPAGGAMAAERLALVIGVGAYAHAPELANPPADARLMARTLRRTGFDVTALTDADQRGMQRAIVDFGRRLRAAGPGAVALFYFAGHGVQAEGRNFLIPTDARITDAADLGIAAVPVAWVMGQMESAGTTNIIILDACRNNPFARSYRSASSGGLARENAPTGSFVAFATAPGGVAADGAGGNSPYTAALARAITAEGEAIEQVFKQVRVDVLAETDGAQVPWESSSLTGDFYFVPDGGAAGRPADDGNAVETAPAPPAALLAPSEEIPQRDNRAARVALRLDVGFRNAGRPCRDARRIDSVTLPLDAARTVDARATRGRPSLDFTLSATGYGQGAAITVLPRDGSSTGTPVTLTVDSLAPGTEATLYSDARHPALAQCGSMVLYATVLE